MDTKNPITQLAQETMDALPGIETTDPHVKAKNLVKKSTSSIKETFQKKLIDHLKGLAVQGQFVRVWQKMEADIQWKSLLFQLPPTMMQFVLMPPHRVLISFTYIVRFPLVDRYWLIVA